jgi:hypothetical protein
MAAGVDRQRCRTVGVVLHLGRLLDPSIPQGVQGKPALIRYLKGLLGNNPTWVWQHLSSIPLEGGFLNRWQASIPVGNRVVDCSGVCSVQVRDGLICRNEVYFDTFELITAIQGWNREKHSGLVRFNS